MPWTTQEAGSGHGVRVLSLGLSLPEKAQGRWVAVKVRKPHLCSPLRSVPCLDKFPFHSRWVKKANNQDFFFLKAIFNF